MNKNQATTAQARYIEALAKTAEIDAYRAAYDRARALNGNGDYFNAETITHQVRRLTKRATHQTINDLKTA